MTTAIAPAPSTLSGDAAVRQALCGATWIGPNEGTPAPAGRRPVQLLRTRVDLPADRPLHLHATAHGVYEVFVDGIRLGEAELSPGFSAYRKRLEVQTYDLTGLVTPGVTTITVLLSDGWYRGRHGFERRADGFGTRTAVLLAVTGADGEPLAVSDAGWQSRPSHLWRADLMEGQAVDLRALDPGWFTGADDGGGWRPVLMSDDPVCADRDRLVAPAGPPVRRIEELAPVALTTPRPGTVVVDLGQVINGWVRLPEVGPSGTHLVLTHGEAVDGSGLVTTDHLRAFVFATGDLLPAGQVDEVISAGRPGEGFEPRHTTHGFRYVRVDGVPDGLDLGGLRGVVVHSDIARTGEFGCSDERLERLHEVVRWSLRTNACAIPTDCPQRERSGFTGDWQIFVGTAALMADVQAFSRRWLRDLAADQWADGRVPTIVPNPAGDGPSGVLFEDASAGSAGWGDAAAIVPWELWRAYGDADALAEQFPAMRRWVDYAAGCAASARHPERAAARPEPCGHEQYLWDTGFHFGEWLEPDVPPAPDARVDHGIVATAYLHRSAAIAAATAAVLGLDDLAGQYRVIAEGARAAWQAEYLLPDGRLTQERQAHYVRALAFGLVPALQRQAAADRLAELVHAADDRLNTGFLATGMLLQVLADHGHAELAHTLLTRTDSPSWLGMLEAGATTMWEYWDGIGPDGTAKGSLDHYSKGAVAGFLHTHLAGLRLPEFPAADEAGYRRVLIAPTMLPGITSARTTQRTAAGPIEVAWRLRGTRFELSADLPPGVEASIDLPDGSRAAGVDGRHVFNVELPQST